MELRKCSLADGREVCRSLLRDTTLWGRAGVSQCLSKMEMKTLVTTIMKTTAKFCSQHFVKPSFKSIYMKDQGEKIKTDGGDARIHKGIDPVNTNSGDGAGAHLDSPITVLSWSEDCISFFCE